MTKEWARLTQPWSWTTERLHFLYTAKERHMADPQPGTERPYQVDGGRGARRRGAARSCRPRRTGAGAAFFLQYLRPGMRLLDCGCGPGSITVDLAHAVGPGEGIGIDLRGDALAQGGAAGRAR